MKITRIPNVLMLLLLMIFSLCVVNAENKNSSTNRVVFDSHSYNPSETTTGNSDPIVEDSRNPENDKLINKYLEDKEKEKWQIPLLIFLICSVFVLNFLHERHKKGKSLHVSIIISDALTILKKYLFSQERKVMNFRYWGISVLISFFLGWYFKIPNSKFLELLAQCDSLWRKNLIIELEKSKTSFFSTEWFDFNWVLFVASTVIIFFVMKMLQDKLFRKRIFAKFGITSQAS